MGQYISSADFANGTYFQLPKALVYDKKYRDLSNDERVVYAILRDRLALSLQNREAFEDEIGLYIYFKQDELAETLSCSTRNVRRIFKALKEHGLILVVQRKVKSPAQIYVSNVTGQIYEDKSVLRGRTELSYGVGQNCPTEAGQNCPTELDRLNNNKTINNRTEAKRMAKPTLEEVETYCKNKHYTFSPQAFWDYYESNGWKVGRNPMKNWKAACAYWQRNQKKFAAGKSRTVTDGSQTDWEAAAQKGWNI